MGYLKDQEIYDRRKNRMNKHEYRCLNCGHSVYIRPNKDKALCEYCNKYVEKNEKINIEHITLINRLKMSYIKFEKKEVIKNEI